MARTRGEAARSGGRSDTTAGMAGPTLRHPSPAQALPASTGRTREESPARCAGQSAADEGDRPTAFTESGFRTICIRDEERRSLHCYRPPGSRRVRERSAAKRLPNAAVWVWDPRGNLGRQPNSWAETRGALVCRISLLRCSIRDGQGAPGSARCSSRAGAGSGPPRTPNGRPERGKNQTQQMQASLGATRILGRGKAHPRSEVPASATRRRRSSTTPHRTSSRRLKLWRGRLKTVTMWAEFFATTEVDLLNTLLKRHEEALRPLEHAYSTVKVPLTPLL